jgi:hypothetical protein
MNMETRGFAVYCPRNSRKNTGKAEGKSEENKTGKGKSGKGEHIPF